ncbi:hypothetical protein HDU93_004128, partial [Gonapodya sp. JEL0774]
MAHDPRLTAFKLLLWNLPASAVSHPDNPVSKCREAARQQHLEKQRQEMLENFAAQKKKIEKDTTVRIGSDKFVALSDNAEAELKRQTVGLVHLEDFQRIRLGIEAKGKGEVVT